MNGIRVNTGVKRIEVNDDGDYITLNLSDNDFIDRFFSLYKNIQKMAEESSAKEKDIRAQYSGGEDQNGLLQELFGLYKEASASMMLEVDKLFGESACKKVFGDITPSFELYLDFFEQLTPDLQQFAAEKAQRLSKYSAARTGNV